MAYQLPDVKGRHVSVVVIDGKTVEWPISCQVLRGRHVSAVVIDGKTVDYLLET